MLASEDGEDDLGFYERVDRGQSKEEEQKADMGKPADGLLPEHSFRGGLESRS